MCPGEILLACVGELNERDQVDLRSDPNDSYLKDSDQNQSDRNGDALSQLCSGRGHRWIFTLAGIERGCRGKYGLLG